MPGFGSVKKPSRGRWSHSIEHLKNEARKSIWFAFQTLIGPNSVMVQTHTLRVLTASIGNALGIEKSEELHDQTDLTELDFSSYFTLIESVMFTPLAKASNETMNLTNIDYQDVHSVCWMLFYNHEKGKTIPEDLPEKIAFKLWMMFNLFAEENDSNCPLFPIVLDPEEATVIFEAILTETGNKNLLCNAKDALEVEPMLFKNYTEVFFVHIYKHVKEGVLKSAVDDVFEQIVFDILKKGNMSKRGHQVKSWKERWMVLTPTELKYYVTSQEKNMKGVIVFDKSHGVGLLPDKGGKHNMFVVKTPQKPYDMNATDTKTRNEWISAIQTAIDHIDDSNYHYHKDQSKQRRQKRNIINKEKEEDERKRKEEEELQRRKGDEYKQRERMNEEMLKEKLKELEDEKRARAELEEQLREQNALREAEQQRMRDLEAIKAELERLLEEERQAKRDEETVRRLQAKLLEEESEKRAEMERLKQVQEQLLQHEREMREGLEDQKEERDKILAEAQTRLETLETERLEASQKLEKATERLQQAEKDRVKMEAKVKLWKAPIGLAKPVQPKITPLVSHRGKGAFCAADFLKKSRLQDKQRGMTKEQLDEKYGDISSGEEENDSNEIKSEGIKEGSDVNGRNDNQDNVNEKDEDINRIGDKDETKDNGTDDEVILKDNESIKVDQNDVENKNCTPETVDIDASSTADWSHEQDSVNDFKNSEQNEDSNRGLIEEKDYSDGNESGIETSTKSQSENMQNDLSEENKTTDFEQEKQFGENESFGEIVQSPYENVTFEFQHFKSEETNTKLAGNEIEKTNDADLKTLDESSQNKKESDPDVLLPTKPDIRGQSDVSSNNNLVYENVTSENSQESKEINLSTKNEPYDYDYVEMRNEHLEVFSPKNKT